MTSAVDVGASGVAYPDDYQALQTLAARPTFPIRISNFLFPPRAGTELEAFEKWTTEAKRDVNHAASRLNGYFLEGAGEILLVDAADYENLWPSVPSGKTR